METKKLRGRPPISPEKRKTYARLAIRPSTYRELIKQASLRKMAIIEYVDKLVDEKR